MFNPKYLYDAPAAPTEAQALRDVALGSIADDRLLVLVDLLELTKVLLSRSGIGADRIQRMPVIANAERVIAGGRRLVDPPGAYDV